MEKVGMSITEVKNTITRQVMMVFFLPLGMAVIHTTVAFPAMHSLLSIFSMYNIWLPTAFTVGSVPVFGVVYLFAYRLTARIYLKIVREWVLWLPAVKKGDFRLKKGISIPHL